MGLTEHCLLATMSYDRCVAINRPLQYSAIMAPGLCQNMVAGACGSGFFSSLVQIVTFFNLYNYGPSIIQHFLCDITQIIPLSCSNPFIILFLVGIFVGFGSFLVILLSYDFISASILKISSIKGNAKALNTCASHLAVVTLFSGMSPSVYLFPSSNHSKKQDKVLSVFYVIFIPMLNRVIYSLRHKEMKEAFKMVMKRVAHLPQ
ncbi:olfactory receptor 5AN6-like [Equus asinus]|uniref:olfactory receptor 5AN6-like n=1 Tax=Equus asinus TaxID=9793 RepID=UPI0038F6ABAB